MKTSAAFSLLAASLVAAGCATTRPTPPPSAELRDRISHVAVVAFSDSTRVRLQVPDSKADIAAEGIPYDAAARELANLKEGTEAAGPVYALGRLTFDGLYGAATVYQDPRRALILTAPVAQELRRAYGLLVADSEQDVTTARAALDRTVAPLRFEQQLRAHVLANLERKNPALVVTPIGTAPRTPAPLPSSASRLHGRPADLWPTNPHAETSYHVSPRDADTILEIKVLEPRLDGSDGINPGLAFGVHVRVRLLAASDRRELYYDYLEYRGAKQTFVNWAAHDARAFRGEIDRSISHLSGEIVTQLFLRGENERAESSQLAAIGLHRRSVAPVAPALSPVWSRAVTRPAYAMNR